MELNLSTADPISSTLNALNAYAVTFRKLSAPSSSGKLLTRISSEGK